MSSYDRGGNLPTGLQTVTNTGDRPERVLTQAEWEALRGN